MRHRSFTCKRYVIVVIYNGVFWTPWLLHINCIIVNWLAGLFPVVTDAFSSDSLMIHKCTELVQPLLWLLCLSMTNAIVINEGTSTLQITSLVMITLISLCVLDPFRFTS